MRKIEKDMVAAVEARRNWIGGNTAVTVQLNGDVHVTLHGNLIAIIGDNQESYYNRRATLAGWPTPTTRSRLRALGFDVRQRDGIQLAGSIEVSDDEWFCDTYRGYDWCGAPE